MSEPSQETSVTADIHLIIPGEETQLAYDNALQELGKAGGRGMPGFRKSAVMAPKLVLAQLGKEQVIKFACDIMLEGLQAKVDQVGLPTVGNARLVTPLEDIAERFVPGKELAVDVSVELAPRVGYTGSYTGLAISVERPVQTPDLLDQVKASLCESYADHAEVLEEGYAAQMGDRLTVIVNGFEKNEDGSQGAPLDLMESEQDTLVIMELGRYVQGLVEGLVGVKVGENRNVDVILSSDESEAVFSVTCTKIEKRSIPEFGVALVQKMGEDLTLEELEQNLMLSMQEDLNGRVMENRNGALEKALEEIVTLDVPEALIIDESRKRFALMMSDFKRKGNSDEEVQKLSTPENFEKFVEICRENTSRQVKVKLALKDIAVREGIAVNPLDVEDQLELLKAEEDEEVDMESTKQNIEEILLKNEVLDWLEQRSVITYVDVPMENAEA